MLAFSNPFSSKILTSALFYREIPIRAAISIAHSEPAIIMRMIDGCEKSKGARCKKIATIIVTVKAMWVFRNNLYAWCRTNGNENMLKTAMLIAAWSKVSVWELLTGLNCDLQ
jgi:hypothetical protein